MIKVKSTYAPENLQYLLSRCNIYPPIKVAAAATGEGGVTTYALASDWLPFDLDSYYELIFTTWTVYENSPSYTTWTIRKVTE
jgi:hypothetical protein